MNHAPSLYPVFLQLSGRKVLVVGGGAVAERKVRALLPSGAHVWVGAPELTPALQAWREDDSIKVLHGAFRPDWLDDAWLVVAATDDRQVNAEVRDHATQRRIWINVVDDPELTAFQVPAVVDRAPLTIAISSGGHAPVLARRLRERLETLVDHGMGRLAGLLAERRPAIRDAYPDLAQRRRFYDWTLDGPLLPLISQGAAAEAAALLDTSLAAPTEWPRSLLTLLPAPTHDPGLLTLKALRALHQADALLFDPNHHDEAVLAMARRDAERLPISWQDWAKQAESAEHLRRLLQEYGRVSLLMPAQGGPDMNIFNMIISELKTDGIIIENLI